MNAAMVRVTLPDGAVREVPQGSSPMDLAREISHGLAKKVLAALIDGEIKEASTPFTQDVNLRLLTWDDAEG